MKYYGLFIHKKDLTNLFEKIQLSGEREYAKNRSKNYEDWYEYQNK